MHFKTDNVSPTTTRNNPAVWKFAVVAFLALFLSAVVVGAIFGSTSNSAAEWFGGLLSVTFLSLFWGVVPALFLGSIWYGFYYRTPGMPFVVYILPGPVFGILIGFVDPTIGFGFAVVGTLFLLILHFLVRQFPGLVG